MNYRFNLDRIDGHTQEHAPSADTQYIVMAILALAERVEALVKLLGVRGPE